MQDSSIQESSFQKRQECDRCLYYTRNPLLYCAVHPDGGEGVCSSFENDPAVEAELRAFQELRQALLEKEQAIGPAS